MKPRTGPDVRVVALFAGWWMTELDLERAVSPRTLTDFLELQRTHASDSYSRSYRASRCSSWPKEEFEFDASDKQLALTLVPDWFKSVDCLLLPTIPWLCISLRCWLESEVLCSGSWGYGKRFWDWRGKKEFVDWGDVKEFWDWVGRKGFWAWLKDKWCMYCCWRGFWRASRFCIYAKMWFCTFSILASLCVCVWTA